MNFCVAQKISARSARSIVLCLHSFTLKIASSSVIGYLSTFISSTVTVAPKILPALKHNLLITV